MIGTLRLVLTTTVFAIYNPETVLPTGCAWDDDSWGLLAVSMTCNYAFSACQTTRVRWFYSSGTLSYRSAEVINTCV